MQKINTEYTIISLSASVTGVVLGVVMGVVLHQHDEGVLVNATVSTCCVHGETTWVAITVDSCLVDTISLVILQSEKQSHTSMIKDIEFSASPVPFISSILKQNS